jgi:hypothetical protein
VVRAGLPVNTVRLSLLTKPVKVTLKAGSGAPKSRRMLSAVTISGALATVRVRLLLASAWLALPAWLAVMVVSPAPTMVTVLPLIVATPVLELLKVTGLPEAPPVALRSNGVSP